MSPDINAPSGGTASEAISDAASSVSPGGKKKNFGGVLGGGLGGLFGAMGAKATAATNAIAGASFFGAGSLAKKFVEKMPAPKFIFMFVIAAIVSIMNYLYSMNRTARIIMYFLYFISFYFFLRQNFDDHFVKTGLVYMAIGIFAADIGNYIVSISALPDTLKNLFLFILLLFGYLGPIILLMVFTNHEENWLSLLLEVALVFFIFFFAITYFIQGDIFGEGAEISSAQKSTFTNIFNDIWQTIRGTPGAIAGVINNTKDNLNRSVAQIKGESYEEEVDAKSGVELGLKLGELQFSNSDGVYFQGNPVSAWSVLEANSLATTIDVKTGCYVDRKQGLTEKRTGEINPDSFSVNNVGYKDIVCKFPRDNFTKVDHHEMEIIANFSFTTSSYLRRYFIDEDDYISLKKNNIEPEAYYEIPLQDEDGVFTVGPVDLSVKKPNLLHALSDDGNSFVVAIEVDVNRKMMASNGNILDINKLVLALPPGFRLASAGGRYDCGQYEFTDYSTNDCIADCRGDEHCVEDCSTYSQYRLKTEINESGLTMSKDDFKTEIVKTPFQIPCFVEPTSKNEIMGQSAIAIKNFRSYIDYDFQVSAVKGFRIEETEGYVNPNFKGPIPGCNNLDSAYLNADYSATESAVAKIMSDAEPILNKLNVSLDGSLICKNLMKALIAYQNRDGSANNAGYGYTEITSEQLEDTGLWDADKLTNVTNTHADVALTSQYLTIKKEECGSIDCALGLFVCGRETGSCVDSRVPLIIEITERYAKS